MNYTIYKIVCKNETVPGIYVGSTKDFVKRRTEHKSHSKNEKNNTKLYNTIRANGGFENWKMEVVEYCTCDTTTDARIRERFYFDQLQANLNSIKPQLNLEEKKLYVVEWTKQYWSNNKEIIKEKNQQFWLENKTKKLQQKSEKIYCGTCDVHHSRGHQSRHYRSCNHISNVAKMTD